MPGRFESANDYGWTWWFDPTLDADPLLELLMLLQTPVTLTDGVDGTPIVFTTGVIIRCRSSGEVVITAGSETFLVTQSFDEVRDAFARAMLGDRYRSDHRLGAYDLHVPTAVQKDSP